MWGCALGTLEASVLGSNINCKQSASMIVWAVRTAVHTEIYVLTNMLTV